jgi:CHRD domain
MGGHKRGIAAQDESLLPPSLIPMNLPVRLLLLFACTLPASAQTITWCVHGTGSQVVPPSGSAAIARAIVKLDTASNLLTWTVIRSDITNLHLGTHFHGPAPVGQTAGIQLQVGVGPTLEGQAFLTAQQAADLQAGLWYLNFHTSAFPGGEMRGQVDQLCQVDVSCTAFANSFDASGARLVTGGDTTAAANNLTLMAGKVTPGQFGYLLIGAGNGMVTPPGSAGQLCLSGAPIGRFTGQVLIADVEGLMGPFTPDLTNLPNPPGGAVMAGDTWGFQLWFRDVGGTSNFSDGLRVTFQ